MTLAPHERVLHLRASLAVHRRTGVVLSPDMVADICAYLAYIAADVEDLELHVARKPKPAPTDEKVVCLARYRRPPPLQPPQPGPGGDDAA